MEVALSSDKLLSLALLYDLVQFAVGADRCRRVFIEQYARVQNQERVLDMGCGTARVLPFLPCGATYVGVDINPRYIARARTLFGDRGRFFVGSWDLPELAALAPFDVVLALFLLHHLSDEQVNAFCSRVRTLMAPNGRFIAIDPCLRASPSRLEKMIMSRDRGSYIRSPNSYVNLMSSAFSEIRAVVRTDLLRIPYAHCIVEARN